MTQKMLDTKLRENYVKVLTDLIKANGYDTIQTNSNEIAIPCVDDEQNEKFILLTVKVPTGSRDGEPYDAYSISQEYQMKLTEKEQKAKKTAEAKAKKIERDKKFREKQNELKEKKG